MTNGLFTESQKKLSSKSWDILTKKEERVRKEIKEKDKRVQRQLKEIYKR